MDNIFQSFFITIPICRERTGLGLSLSYNIVRAYGEEIKVERKEGEETMFIVSISSV